MTVEQIMSRRRSRRHRRPAPVLEVAPVQQPVRPFPLDDLAHLRLAAWESDNPFFEQVRVDESYSRTLFCHRAVLLVVQAPRQGWRAYLACFLPAEGSSWFTLLPHAVEHDTAAGARKTAEALAAQMHAGSWQQAISLFAADARPSAA